MTIFIELALIVLIAAFLSLIMRLLRQPLIVGYIITGILVGPYVFDALHAVESLELFSKIGIAILLFIVGLHLNPSVIKEVGRVSVIASIGQIVCTTLFGFLIVKGFGFSNAAAFYTAIGMAFSSTIVVLKLLSDKGDLSKTYGKISVGFLIVEDIVAILVLLFISASASTESTVTLLTTLIIKGVLVTIVLYLISKYLLPKFTRFFASSQELLFLFSLAWGFSLAALFYTLGFSLEIGALIAGVTLSVSPFSYEIGSRLKPLRDFFVVLFFIYLGSEMVLDGITKLLLPALVLTLFVLLIKPLFVFIFMNLFGYRRRIGFFAALTLSQISEFSLIVATLALTSGHISREVVSLITLVGIATIAISAYMVMHSDSLYKRLEWLFKALEIRKKYRRERGQRAEAHDIILFGYDRVGSDFVNAAEKVGKDYIVVDFNPKSIQKLQEKNIPFKYGDAEDVEFLNELNFNDAQLIVSTIPDFKTNMLLTTTYRQVNSTGVILVISHDIDQAKKLYLAGASYVIMPHYLGAHYAAQMISRFGTDPLEFERERNHHLSRLSKREQ